MSELRGAQRLWAAGFRTLEGALDDRGEPRYAESPDIERLAHWLSEHAATTFETADAAEVVTEAIRQLEFAVEANRRFCELNASLERVVQANLAALRKEGFVR